MAKVNPIVLHIEDGETYTLEFSRESVVSINRLGFKLNELENNLEEMLPLLFYGAFRMHHKDVTRKQADDILINGLGGLSPEVAERLILLYGAPRQTLIRENDEETDEIKNSRKVKVTL